MLAAEAIRVTCSFLDKHFTPVPHTPEFDPQPNWYMLLWQTEEFIHFTLLHISSSGNATVSHLHPEVNVETTSFASYVHEHPKYKLMGVWVPKVSCKVTIDPTLEWSSSFNCLSFCLETLGIPFNGASVDLGLWQTLLRDESFVKSYLITEALITGSVLVGKHVKSKNG